MKVATNLLVREPPCLKYRGLNYYRNFHDGMAVGQTSVYCSSPGTKSFSLPVMYSRGPVAFAMAAAPLAEGAGVESSSFDVTIRTYFPETWIWQLAQVGLVKHFSCSAGIGAFNLG